MNTKQTWVFYGSKLKFGTATKWNTEHSLIKIG